MVKFITPGTIKAGLSILMFLAATTGHKQLSALLANHDVVEGILAAAGIFFGISAGLSPGLEHHSQEPEEFDYTGWKWDSINGWVRDDQTGGNGGG